VLTSNAACVRGLSAALYVRVLLYCRDSVEKYGSRPCLGWRTQQDAEGKVLGPYTFMTYKEAWDKSVQVCPLRLGSLRAGSKHASIMGARHQILNSKHACRAV
jgi:hypothetical protein